MFFDLIMLACAAKNLIDLAEGDLRGDAEQFFEVPN